MTSFNRSLWVLGLFVSAHASAGMVSLGDINGDASPDIAVLNEGAVTATVKDAVSGVLIQTVTFDGTAAPIRFIAVPDVNGNGAPELLVLRSTVPQTEMRDSLSGNLLSAVGFNANFDPVDVAVVSDQDGSGAPELALLGKRASTGHVKVETRDALSGNLLANAYFSGGCTPRQLLVLPDLDGNALPELAALCVKPGYVKVEIRNTTGALVRNVGLLQSADHVQMALFEDVSGDGLPEVALLRDRPDVNMLHVLLLDALTGTLLDKIPFNRQLQPAEARRGARPVGRRQRGTGGARY